MADHDTDYQSEPLDILLAMARFCRLSYDFINKKVHLTYPDVHGKTYRELLDYSKVLP